MTPWHLSSLYVFLLRQSGASLSCGPRGLGGGVCPHLGLHTRIEVSYAVYQQSRHGRLEMTDRSRVAWRLRLQIFFQSLRATPRSDHMVANQDGEFAVLPHHGRFLVSRQLGRMNLVGNENPAEDGLGELQLNLARVVVAPEAWQPQIMGPSSRLVRHDVNLRRIGTTARKSPSTSTAFCLASRKRKRPERCKNPIYNGSDGFAKNPSILNINPSLLQI